MPKAIRFHETGGPEVLRFEEVQVGDQGLRRHVQHLRVQTLAHLRAAVVELDAAVGIDVHQRAGLVVLGLVEGDAELDRRDRQPALALRAGGVEGVECGAAAMEIAVLEQLRPQCREVVVHHRLPVGRGVALRHGIGAVEVALAHQLAELCDRSLIISADYIPRIQEAQAPQYHVLCDLLDAAGGLLGHAAGTTNSSAPRSTWSR